MGLRTADIEKPIIIQIDGETHMPDNTQNLYKRIGLTAYDPPG